MTPDFVLVPGMFCVGEVVYRDLVNRLQTTLPQATSHVINLPSVDAISTKADLQPNGLEADINAIRSKIRSLVENGKSVVIIAHSYGGTPALYACEGFWKRQLPNAAGSVIKALLLSSSLSLPGETIAGDRQVWKQENGQIEDPTPELEQHGKEMFVFPVGYEQAWMNDLPDHTELRASLRPSPLSTAITPTPQVDVKNWNIAYMATTDLDVAMPEPFQKHMVDRARKNGASVEYNTIKSGHFVQVSHADEVAQWIGSIV